MDLKHKAVAGGGGRARLSTLLFARPEWDERRWRGSSNRPPGFKPYWYLAGDSLDAVTLADMISPAMLRLAGARRLIVMTHIPRTGRLADPRNIDGLQRLCDAAPNAQFVLAHLGRSYTPESIRPIDALCDRPNLWADCSMVQDWEVIAHALSVFPRDRFLFGLDLPIAQEKGKLISVNGQRHFFTARPHRWSVHAEPGSYEVRCTLFAYEIVRALLKGAKAAGVGEGELRAIFWDNAQRLMRWAAGVRDDEGLAAPRRCCRCTELTTKRSAVAAAQEPFLVSSSTLNPGASASPSCRCRTRSQVAAAVSSAERLGWTA
jgi:hypothetical protein